MRNYLHNSVNDDDPLNIYLSQIWKIPRLTVDEEIKIGIEAKNGDSKAKAKLIEHNLRLVVFIARPYFSKRTSFLDLINEGNVGLCEAVERYDPDKGAKFSSYACWWIRQAIFKYLTDNSRVIRIPTNKVSKLHKIIKGLEEGKNLPTLSSEINLSIGESEKLLTLSEVSSLDALLFSGDSQGDTICSVISSNYPNPSKESTEEIFSREMLDCLKKTLTPREFQVIEARFGLNGIERETLRKLGKVFNLSYERVSQIEEKALRKLKNSNMEGMYHISQEI